MMVFRKRLRFYVSLVSFFLVTLLFLGKAFATEYVTSFGSPFAIAASLVQQSYLKPSNTEGNDLFAWSVDISGNTVVIGAINEGSNATGINGDQSNNSAFKAGAAYVYVRNGTSWNQQAYLKASNTGIADAFGFSVAISGDTLVIGATNEGSNATGINGDQNNNSAGNAGAVYVFTRSGTVWSQQAYLKASNAEAGDMFGEAVAIDGNTLVVGAPREDSSTTGFDGNQDDNSALQSGAVYVFTRNGTEWSQQAYLKASNTDVSDRFGWSVAVSGESVVVGAIRESSSTIGINGDQDDNSATSAGASYIFVRDGVTWVQEAYIKASNTDRLDGFGRSVAISGDTVVVSASSEDSNATGVNGDQSDNSESGSGAAYVFSRNDNLWGQEAYLKAADVDRGDQFGWSVSISGDTVAVGALSVDNVVEGDEFPLRESGAAHIYKRSDNEWTHQERLVPSNPDSGDIFGTSLAISGGNLVVGAPREDSSSAGVNGDQADNSATDSGAAYLYAHFGINAGMNDAWVSDDAPYQGFFFTVFPDLQFFFLSWFTFDSVPPGNGASAVFGAANQRWMTGGDMYSGDRVTISVELTSGGIFNGSDPLATQQPAYGTITIVFTNCNEAVLTYDFPSLGLSGQMTLTRAVPDNVALCDALIG